MTSIDTAFTRLLLSKVHAEVRTAFPEIPNLRTAAGATSSRRGEWFVQISTPDRPLFDWNGRAFNAYEARYKAWSAFLHKYQPEEGDNS